MKKKYFLLIAASILLLVFLLRTPILRSFGAFLIYENDLPPAIESIFVLSGGSLDRGNKAYELSNQIPTDSIICTGANVPPDLKVIFNDSILESDLTAWQIQKRGYDSTRLRLIREGTSTAEEADVILAYCKKHQLQSIVIVSSKFHTRRIKQVFLKRYKKEGIDVKIVGAPSSVYDEKVWWQNEYGLIAVNNEYLKQLFYLITEQNKTQ